VTFIVSAVSNTMKLYRLEPLPSASTSGNAGDATALHRRQAAAAVQMTPTC